MNLSHITRRGTRSLRRGFTLIELLVVIAIITIVSAVILANNNKFGGAALLQNLAYDVALSVRQAQVYGISVKQNSTGSFNSGYGMHFSLSTPNAYDLFADVAQTGIYAVHEDVAPSPYSIGQGFELAKLCVTPASGVEDCSPTSLDILFIRPEPDACIGINGVTDVTVTGTTYGCSASDHNQRARVVLTSPRGDYMSVVVYANGQISVAADPSGT